MLNNFAGHQNKNSYELIERAKIDSEAMGELVSQNMAFIVKQSKRFPRNPIFDFDDVIQEGIMGYMHGVMKFDTSKGYNINTYCGWWVKQYTTKFIYENSYMARIPQYIYELMSRYSAAKYRYLAKHYDIPKPQQVFNFGDFTAVEQKNILKYFSTNLKHNQSNQEDEDYTINSAIWEDLYNKRFQKIDELFSVLNPRLREILIKRFGEDKTLKEIGEEFNLTKEAIRLNEKKALELIRAYCRRNKYCYDDFILEDGE